jgi:hypothetical protein
LALRFLAAGALTFVGSTKVAYGAIAPPIVGADLLSRYFWEGLLAHLTVGEALKRAKVQLAHEMQERQGYLDGEDQKTLTSFVLYGDPSLPVLPPRTLSNGGGGSARALTPTLICQKAKAEKGLLSEEVVAGVKSLVESNLPHMNDAHLRAARVQVCTGACAVGGCLHEGTGACASRWRAKGEAKRVLGVPRRWSLTLEKAIPIDEGAHRQIVKVTVDEGGQVLKMAVSK